MLGRLAAACAVPVAVVLGWAAAAQAQRDRLPPLPFSVSVQGEQPDIAVDAEGSAHVVWNEEMAGDAADVLHYCRVPRRQRSCAVHQRLIPNEPDPQFNDEAAGPEVVLLGPEQVAVLTHRYPNVVTVDNNGRVTPDCHERHPPPSDVCYGSSSKTYAFYSIDNGTTFGAEDVFNHASISGGAISMIADVPAPGGAPGLDEAPLIATISDTVSGGTFFSSAPPLGYARQAINLGDGGQDRAYSGRLAADGDKLPVAAFADLGSRIFLRRYRGEGPLNNIATWPAANQVALGSDPRLAGGPGGVQLAYKPQGGDDYIVRRVQGTGVSAAATLSDGGNLANPEITQDDAGTLHGAWVRRAAGGDELRYRFAPDGSTFSGTTRLARRGASSIWNVGLGAAEDGGGFAVFSSSLFGNGEITLVPFGSQQLRKLIDVRVSAIEVTQAIQKQQLPTRPLRTGGAANNVAYDGVPLAANQRTVVRVYAKARRPLAAGVPLPTMTLRAFRDGRELAGPYLPDRVGPVPAEAGDAVSSAQRSTADAAWTFTLPWQAATGTLTLEAEINPPGLRPSVAECRRCRADNKLRISGIPFQATRPMTILPISVTINGTKPAGYPDSSVPFAGVRAVTPLRVDIPAYRTDIDVSDIANAARIRIESCFLGIFPCDSEERAITLAEKTSLARQRVADWASDNAGSSSLFPVGVFPAALLAVDGTSSGGAANAAGRLYGSEQPVAIVADSRPLTSVAHEVHHGLGRVHAGLTCGSHGDGQVGESWPPNDDGALGAEVGLDRRPGVPFQPLVPGEAGQPATFFDFMSYCPVGGGANESVHWISIRNWTRALDENRAAAGAARAQLRRPPRQVRRVAPARPAQARSLRVLAMVAGDASPTIISVAPDAGPATADQGNGLRLVGRDADGKEIRSAGAVLQPVHQDGMADAQIVSGRIGAAGVEAVDLVRDGQPVAQRLASKNRPRVAVRAPRRGASVGGKGNVLVRWSAKDRDADPLLAQVEYSADGGRSYRTVQVGPSTGKAVVPAGLFAASRNARIRIRVQDGFHEAVATSARFRSRAAPPAVRISSPEKGTRLTAGAVLSLAGEAHGSDGRALARSRLTWRDGRRVIGRGDRVSVNGIGPGVRRISLTARERGGPAGTARVKVRVERAVPRFTVLKAPRRLTRKARRVKLTVATSFPAQLRAGKKRFALDRKPRRVKFPIRRGRGVLELDLLLRSGGLRATEQILIPRR